MVECSTSSQLPSTQRHRSGTRSRFGSSTGPPSEGGDFPLNRQSFLDLRPRRGQRAKVAAWNLGNKLGLTGHASLMPLYLFWVVDGNVSVGSSTGNLQRSRYREIN